MKTMQKGDVIKCLGVNYPHWKGTMFVATQIFSDGTVELNRQIRVELKDFEFFRRYYEKYGLLFYDSEPWEKKIYLFHPNGMGDVLKNTMWYSIQTGEMIHLKTCSRLLNLGKRWPDEIQRRYSEFIAKNRIDWEWSKFKRFCRRINRWMNEDGEWKELTKVDQVLFRPQHHITRDPVCWYFSTAILNGQSHFIYKYNHPWNLNTSITFWAWVRFIKTGKCEGLYLLLENRKPLFKPREYVNRMQNIRLRVYYHLKANM